MTSFDFWLAVASLIGLGVSVIGGLILRDRYKRREDD